MSILNSTNVMGSYKLESSQLADSSVVNSVQYGTALDEVTVLY